MNKVYRFIIGSFFAVTVIVGLSQPAYALPAGCAPAKHNTFQQIAEVRVAYDAGATGEIVPKPDSALELSCFSRASQISAEKGGGIFSGGTAPGSFMANLNSIIQVSTVNISTNFGGGLMDQFGISAPKNWGTANFTAPDSSGAAGCNNMKNVWSVSQSSGIETDASFMDLDQILTISMAPAPVAAVSPGNTMEYKLTNSSAAATSAWADLTAPIPVIPMMDTDANGNGQLDTCDVLRNLIGGAVAGC